MSERRKQQRRLNERRTDLLAETFQDTTGEEIRQRLEVSDARIELRCPSTTKEQIEATAGRFGLTVTTYLLRLHELAHAKLEE
jgi:predicted DNA binding CopG/RHH family protein